MGIFACKHNPIAPIIQNMPCDSTNISFKTDILPILNQHCNGCHGSTQQNQGIILDDYANIKIFALEGSLYGAIIQDGNYAPMPYAAPKLDSCSIAKINNWKKEGLLNN